MGTSIDHSCTRCVALWYLPDIACHADTCAACRNLCNSCNRPHSLDGWILIRPHLSSAILPLILSARLHYRIYTWFFSDGNIQNISLVHFSLYKISWNNDFQNYKSVDMTIKAFWHNVLFVMFAHIHFAPCDVCACCFYDKWTAQRVFTYSHWSDDALYKQDKNKHLDKSSIRLLPNFSLSYFHILCSNRSSFQFWQTQDKLKTNLLFGQSPLSTESEFPLIL